MTHTIYDQRWLQWLLGLSPENAKKIDQTHLSFAAPWLTLSVITLLVVAAIWFSFFYWRDGSRPSWWMKGPMVVLRLIALGALISMIAQPVLRLSHADRIQPSVILMVDTSDSMNRGDPKLPAARAEVDAAGAGVPVGSVAAMTRLARANAILNHGKALTELSKRYSVRLYPFASKPRIQTVPTEAAKRSSYRFDIEPDPQTATSTQIGSSLRRPLEDLAGQPIAGALIVSDGENNLGEDPILVAETARQSNVRVSTMGLGDPTKTKDIAILSVLADDVVRINNNVTV